MAASEDARPLAEKVRSALMQEILGGHRPPGDKLIEEEIAARFHCSRTPVREALRHLAALGLIKFVPHQGARVAAPDPGALHDLQDAMAELESICAELAASRLTEADRTRLREVQAKGAGADEVLDLLHDAVGNAVLADMASSVRKRLQPRWSHPANDEACSLRPVVEAVLAGDGVAARQAMRAMIQSSIRHNCPDHAQGSP